MRYDVMNEYYTEIRLFGKPALFNDMRLDQETCLLYTSLAWWYILFRILFKIRLSMKNHLDIFTYSLQFFFVLFSFLIFLTLHIFYGKDVYKRQTKWFFMQIIENLCPHYNLSFLIFQFIIFHDSL